MAPLWNVGVEADVRRMGWFWEHKRGNTTIHRLKFKLTLWSPVVTIFTARFTMQQSYVLVTQCIYGSQNKQRLFLYTTLT